MSFVIEHYELSSSFLISLAAFLRQFSARLLGVSLSFAARLKTFKKNGCLSPNSSSIRRSWLYFDNLQVRKFAHRGQSCGRRSMIRQWSSLIELTTCYLLPLAAKMIESQNHFKCNAGFRCLGLQILCWFPENKHV